MNEPQTSVSINDTIRLDDAVLGADDSGVESEADELWCGFGRVVLDGDVDPVRLAQR